MVSKKQENKKVHSETINLQPEVEIYDPVQGINQKFDLYIKIVVGVLMIGFAALLATVAGMVIDSWRFNSSIYKESQQIRIQNEFIQNTVDLQIKTYDSLQNIEKKLELLEK